MNSKENSLFSFLVHLIVRLVIGYLQLGNWIDVIITIGIKLSQW
jgi:hypothetical protein